jgi:hypothetical protein
MQKRTMCLLGFVLVETCLVLQLIADQKPPVFVFGGNRLYVGMPKHEAVASLSACCKLSPPAESEVETQPAPGGMMPGHFIVPKEESPQRILGSVYFSGGKIIRITRPLDGDVDTSSDDVVGFARALKRSISTETADSETAVLLSVRHERTDNAESDVVFLRFRSGRGIELHIGTLDKANTRTDKRDFATLDEFLEPPRQK